MITTRAREVLLPALPGISITVSMTREGEVTAPKKTALLLSPQLVLLAVFETSHQMTQHFLATSVTGPRLLLATDLTAPRRAAASYPEIVGDIVLELDLNDGTGGGGGGGQPAVLHSQVRLSQQPAERPLVVLGRSTEGVWQVVGAGQSGADGIAVLDLRVAPSASVYAVAVDDWGVAYQPGLPVVVGQRIRPTQFAGWLYQVTEAGTLPASEPVWWPAEGDNAPRQLGTARAVAVRYYQPLAHGPVPVEVL